MDIECQKGSFNMGILQHGAIIAKRCNDTGI